MTIAASDFVGALEARGVEFFAGVPDSLLSALSAHLAQHAKPTRHLIAANEGAAVALAAGFHLATGRFGCVYLQNSGLGNAVNPLVSLADPEVSALPLLLVIGWRGEPGVRDEPQHQKQGRITLEQLRVLEIPHEVLAPEPEALGAALDRLVAQMKQRQGPVALVVRKDTFAAQALSPRAGAQPVLSRERAIELVADACGPDVAIVCTTGMASRELDELRVRRGQSGAQDFLTVGAMGHASQLALGVALGRPERRVLALDGDGAALMHLGALATIGRRGPKNLVHVVLNNGAHASVGGQPTLGLEVELTAIARACGYRSARVVEGEAELREALTTLLGGPGPALVEVRVNLDVRAKLGRPKVTPRDAAQAFRAWLREHFTTE